MFEMIAMLLVGAAKIVEVDHCELRDFWRPVMKENKVQVPEGLKDDVLRFIGSGWRGKYKVEVTIDDGKMSDPRIVSSDPGGPDDKAKISVLMVMSGHYQPAASNPDRKPVRVVLPAGGIPAEAAKDTACPTP